MKDKRKTNRKISSSGYDLWRVGLNDRDGVGTHGQVTI